MQKSLCGLIAFGYCALLANASWCSKCNNSCSNAIFSDSTCTFLKQNAIISSPNGSFFLHMRPNGLLVLYEKSTGIAQWHSEDPAQNPSFVFVQGNGNLCTYHYNATTPTWCTDTYQANGNGKQPFCMVVQNNGSLALYDDKCKSVWVSTKNISSQHSFASTSEFSSLVVADTIPISVDEVIVPKVTLMPAMPTTSMVPSTANASTNTTNIPTIAPVQSSSSTGVIIGSVVGAIILIAIVVLLYMLRQRRKAQSATYRDGLASPPSLDATIDSSNQILPQYQHPYYPFTKESDAKDKSRELKYDKILDDDKVLDMRPLRKYRLDPSDLIMVEHSPIASGAHGEVWLGKLGSMQVAIKRLKKQSSNLKIQKFIEEVILMTKIDCPYTVRFIGASWLTPQDLSCVVEYMDYGDLKTFLANTTQTQFTWQQKRLSILAVVKGLSYLHNCATPIIHRDLKSRNVLLDSKKGTKLTDFGESREMDDSTMTNDVGTFAWMAPEVITGRKYDAAADIYSFGVLLTEYASHQIPYASLVDPVTKQPYNQFQVISQITTGQLKPTIDPSNSPRWVIDLASQCLMFDPNERPSILAIESIITKLPE